MEGIIEPIRYNAIVRIKLIFLEKRIESANHELAFRVREVWVRELLNIAKIIVQKWKQEFGEFNAFITFDQKLSQKLPLFSFLVIVEIGQAIVTCPLRGRPKSWNTSSVTRIVIFIANWLWMSRATSR